MSSGTLHKVFDFSHALRLFSVAVCLQTNFMKTWTFHSPVEYRTALFTVLWKDFPLRCEAGFWWMKNVFWFREEKNIKKGQRIEGNIFVRRYISGEDYLESLQNKRTKEKLERDANLLKKYLTYRSKWSLSNGRWKRLRAFEFKSIYFKLWKVF